MALSTLLNSQSVSHRRISSVHGHYHALPGERHSPNCQVRAFKILKIFFGKVLDKVTFAEAYPMGESASFKLNPSSSLSLILGRPFARPVCNT